MPAVLGELAQQVQLYPGERERTTPISGKHRIIRQALADLARAGYRLSISPAYRGDSVPWCQVK